MSREPVKNLELSATAYDLFGYKYGNVGGEEHLQDVPERDGRVFKAKVTYRF